MILPPTAALLKPETLSRRGVSCTFGSLHGRLSVAAVTRRWSRRDAWRPLEAAGDELHTLERPCQPRRG